VKRHVDYKKFSRHEVTLLITPIGFLQNSNQVGEQHCSEISVGRGAHSLRTSIWKYLP